MISFDLYFGHFKQNKKKVLFSVILTMDLNHLLFLFFKLLIKKQNLNDQNVHIPK